MTESALEKARREAHEACPCWCVSGRPPLEHHHMGQANGYEWLTGCSKCGEQHAKIARLEAAAREEERKEE